MLLITLFKLIATSFLLVAFYFVALRNSSSYRQRRIYLCSIPMLSILLAIVRLEVNHTPMIQMPVPLTEFAEQIMTPQPSEGGANFQEIVMDYPVESTTAVHRNSSLVDLRNTIQFAYERWVQEELIVRVYLFVSFLLFLYLLVGFFSISRILRNGRREELCGYEICTSQSIKTPFSFMRTIFLSNTITPEKREMVVLHEIGHISNKHYLDVLFINVVFVFLWFNPVMWWIRQELRDIAEFEADKYTLQSGVDLYSYQTSILEEVLNASPTMANGYNSSFIKKRFITMKKQLNKPAGKVAKMALFSFLAFLFCSFCLVNNHAKIADTYPSASSEFYPANSPLATPLLVVLPDSITAVDEVIVENDGGESFKEIDRTEEIDSNTTSLELPTNQLSSSDADSLALLSAIQTPVSNSLSSAIKVISVTDSLVVSAENEDVVSPSIIKMHDNPIDYYYIDDKYIEVLPQKTNHTVVYSIEKKKNETIVTLSTPMYYDWNWIHTSPMILVDNRTGDVYKLRSMGEGMPLDRSIVIRNKRGRNIAVRYHFPPLKKSVTSFDLIEIESADVEKPSNGGGAWDFKSVKVSKYLLTDKNRPKVYE